MPKNTLLKQDEHFDGLPPWMANMRKAVIDCISDEDVKEIVQNQVKRAKEGDQNAIKFVFNQLLGGDALKGATFVQNNYHGEAPPSKPIKALPGTPDKIEAMRRRVEAGLPATDPDDAARDHS